MEENEFDKDAFEIINRETPKLAAAIETLIRSGESPKIIADKVDNLFMRSVVLAAAHYLKEEISKEKISVSLSGTTLLAQSWDSGRYPIETGEGVEGIEFAAALRSGKTIKSGRGYRVVVVISRRCASWLSKYLRETGEVYALDGSDDEVRSWARALGKDADRIDGIIKGAV